jgi:TRAP-type C4-dicarboxylate transport system substrate-binding protein
MDSFIHNHQSALDSFMEDKAIQDLEDAGIYPVPDNDAILENLYDEAYDELSEKYPDYSDETLDKLATSLAQGKFEELPEPLDNS